MGKQIKRTYCFETKNALVLLANAIKAGRKRNKMTQQELADRVGVSRSTLRRIESADPACEIGTVFEAAYIAGVTLIGDKEEKAKLASTVESLLHVLPKKIKHKDVAVHDDF